MRWFVVWLGLAGVMSAQSLTEYGAAAIGGATGGAAGKKVSDGITAIFGKVDKQTADAAKQGKPDAAAKTPDTPARPSPAAPAVASAPSVSSKTVPSPPKPAPKTLKRPAPADQTVAKTVGKKADKDDAYNLVPPPPPIRRVAIGKPVNAPARLVALTPSAATAPPLPVLAPPPPPVTAEDLRRISPGTHREDLLKLGTFASRITMIDNGHLSETFRYPAGVVRVSDGVVAAVEIR
jgi:hypothetical protein